MPSFTRFNLLLACCLFVLSLDDLFAILFQLLFRNCAFSLHWPIRPFEFDLFVQGISAHDAIDILEKQESGSFLFRPSSSYELYSSFEPLLRCVCFVDFFLKTKLTALWC